MPCTEWHPVFKERCKESGSNPRPSPAQLTLCGNIPGNWAFFTGQAPEAHVSLPAHPAGVSWWLPWPGKQQAVVGARTCREPSPGLQEGWAALQEGEDGQPPAREACAPPAHLHLWERGVGLVIPRVSGCWSVLEMKVCGDFIHPGFSSVLVEGCFPGCHFFRVQLSEDPKWPWGMSFWKRH